MRHHNGNDSNINQNHQYNNSITITSNNNNSNNQNNNISSSINNNSNNAINIINNNNSYSKKFSSSNGNIKTGIPLKSNNTTTTTTNNFDDTDFVNNKTIILNKKDVNERTQLKSVKVTEINENLMQNGFTNYKQLENDANRLNNYYNKLNGCLKTKNFEKSINDESVIKTNSIQQLNKLTNGFRNGYNPVHQTDCKSQSPQTPPVDTNRTYQNGNVAPNSPLRYSQNGIKQNGVCQSRYSQNGLNNSKNDIEPNINDSVVPSRYSRKQSVTENKIFLSPENVQNCQNEISLNGVSHNYVRQNDVSHQNGAYLNGNSTDINGGYIQNGESLSNGNNKMNDNLDECDEMEVNQNGYNDVTLNGNDCALTNGNVIVETEKNKLAGRCYSKIMLCAVFFFNI